MTTFKILLFAPGLAPGGVPGEAWFQAGQLTVAAGDALRLSVPATLLSVSAGGFDGRQWRLEWGGPEGRIAVVLPAGGIDPAVLDQLPPVLTDCLRREQDKLRGRQARLHVAYALLAFVVLLPLILLGVFWTQSDRVAAWAAGHVSLEQEVQLGELAFAQMRPSLELVQAGPALDAVEAIGNRLTAGSVYHYQWHVAADPQVNAFALPGGHVVVFTGLLGAAASAEEVAGVLAHEAQHVEQRHSLKNLLHGLGWRALLAVALGDLSGGIWAGMAEQLGSLSYSRDLERQADMGGLAALGRAGIAPQGMASFFARLAQQDGTHIELLSTHPASEARMQALQAAIAAPGSDAATLPYDWAALRRSLPVLP